MKDRIEIEITPDSLNGLERKLKHVELRISENLEMTQGAKVEYYKDGVLINDFIDAGDLTPSQKDQRKRMYQTVRYSGSTDGVMVDPKTGEKLTPPPSGWTDEERVTELEFWQNLPAAFFTSANLNAIAPGHAWRKGDLLSDLVYNALQFSLLKIAERERV